MHILDTVWRENNQQAATFHKTISVRSTLAACSSSQLTLCSSTLLTAGVADCDTTLPLVDSKSIRQPR